MKELSTEEKVRRYDEILAKAKAEYAKFEGMLPGDVLEDVIPELKESDDEKIRKWIINEIKIKHHNLDEDNIDFVDKALAWLEKQGEQKSANKVEPKFHERDWVVISTTEGDTIVQIASVEYFKNGNPYYITTEGRWFGNGTKAHLLPDKVEPKFKVGDWIVTKANNLYQVMAIIDDNYQLNYGDNYIIQKCVDIDKNARLWSIEDAIKVHAKTYSFNIESVLFPQLTIEQQKIWRKEIEQACISGGMYILLRLKIN